MGTTTTENYGSIMKYTLYKRVTETDFDSPAANMKTITVTVFWDSDDHSVGVKTIPAQ